MCISDDWFYQSIYSCILSPQTHCQKFTPKITTIHPPFQNPGAAPEIPCKRQKMILNHQPKYTELSERDNSVLLTASLTEETGQDGGVIFH